MIKQGKRKKYLDKAMEVFRYDGLRLSLDELADKMGITKKTLYNHFESKDLMLCECVQSLMSDMRDDIHKIFMQKKDTEACLVDAFEEVDKIFARLSPIFFYDMKKMYPQFSGPEHSVGFGFFYEEVLGNIKKGMSEGVYRNDLDPEFISDYITYTTFSYYFNKLITGSNVVVKDFFKNSIVFHLRSLKT